MTLETEAVLDRRRLRSRLSLWRTFAVIAGLLAIGLLLFSSADRAGLLDTRQIARVTIEGMITEDRDLLRMLQKIGESKHVSGVIVAVNSPGGTTAGGEALFEALRDIAKTKPVVAQFGTVATSAAYIAGLATDQIVVHERAIDPGQHVVMHRVYLAKGASEFAHFGHKPGRQGRQCYVSLLQINAFFAE